MVMFEKNKQGVSTSASVYLGKPQVRGDAIMDKEYLNAQLGGLPTISEQLFLNFDKEPE